MLFPVVVLAALLPLSDSGYVTSKLKFFNQTLDHFDPQNNATFLQRYYVQTDYCDESPSECPIFLYICGEYTCQGIPDDYIQVLAYKMKAVVVMPEHRYYGSSLPFEELTMQNLRFLSSKQAITVSSICSCTRPYLMTSLCRTWQLLEITSRRFITW